MGLMDSLKKATGLGLNANEHYDRAFEKAVLLGPTRFKEAVEYFDTAAKKAGEAGDVVMQTRATANARLYGFVTTGDPSHLPHLSQALAQMQDIEKIGTKTETVPAAPLLTEIEGRLAEGQVACIPPEDHAGRAQGHLKTAEIFKRLFNQPLITYQFQRSDVHVGSGQQRFFLHQGMASRHLALHAVLHDPEMAAEHMAKALNAFRQCNDQNWTADSQAWLARCRQRRTCWMCHRESQGAEVHFKSYPSTVYPYAKALVESLGQDASALDVQAGAVVLCAPCGSALERQADAYAQQRTNELRQEMFEVLNNLTTAVSQLSARVQYLESVAHHH